MHRIYAFQVSPQRTVSHIPIATGGAIDASPELIQLFGELIPASKIESQSIVHLRSDDGECNAQIAVPIRRELTAQQFYSLLRDVIIVDEPPRPRLRPRDEI